LGDHLEQRAKLLDGLNVQLEQYEHSSEDLSAWLSRQSDKLEALRPAQELNTGEQVQEQLDMLRAMEKVN
jgi:hypothetical protein